MREEGPNYKFKENIDFKFADQSYDDAFSKLVALETLNKDKAHIIYYIVNMEYLWCKSEEPLVLTDEVKEDKNWKDCIKKSVRSKY